MNLVRINNRYPGNLSVLDEIFVRNFPDLHRNDKRGIALPSVNISEQENQFEIELIAPGFNKDSFQIDLSEQILTIKTETQENAKEDSKKYSRQEYAFSGFERKFSLPDTIDDTKIEAVYEQGVLHLILPKKEAEQIEETKKILVS